MPNPNTRNHYYIFEGKVYDLKDWIPMHPGGSMWFNHSYGRDLTTMVYSYHKQPELVRKLLAKYETKIPVDQVLQKGFNVPDFILPPGFDAAKDIMVFDWSKPDSILEKVKKEIYGKEMSKKIKRADFLFDLSGVLLLAVHIFMAFYGVYYEILPAWLMVIFFYCSRTGLAAVGHYHNHRKKDGITDWGDPLFDMQYVGASIIAFDGHSLIHHSQTNSLADVKRTVFTGITELPRIWRVPAETIRRFGHLFSGTVLRWASIPFIDNENYGRPMMKQIGIGIIRALLFAEFAFSWYTGHLTFWFIQYFVAMWINLFMIVSSHDFEEGYGTKADCKAGQDWAKFQIDNSIDMWVCGNSYIDAFLTAGLGCHRVHHLLPLQKSGYSNVMCIPIVRKYWEEAGYKWENSQHFFWHRLPKLASYYLLSTPRGAKYKNIIHESLSLTGLLKSIHFCLIGFLGIGSI